VREVSSLDHEVGDYAVELAALEVQGLAARLAVALLARAESPEVLSRLGHSLAEEAHHDAACGLSVHLDVEEDLAGDGLHLRLALVAAHQSHHHQKGECDEVRGKHG
jgi:hypothetical protein